ncbi:MAG: RecQ family ATP-dependent DNA helicase [Gammaproteobacteria bacterium]|nr:RecQ family ATP-dependent DNA helicase [Gammaproteobacteria bacterium]
MGPLSSSSPPRCSSHRHSRQEIEQTPVRTKMGLLTPENLPNEIAFIDLEVNRLGEIFAIAAVRGEESWQATAPFSVEHSLPALAQFCAPARAIAGHNLIHHDLPLIQKIDPQLPLLQQPIIDTLYLSPLAFPENPYHRLVKGYRLVRESLNDPLADARIARKVLCEQIDALRTRAKRAPDHLAILRYGLEGMEEHSGWSLLFNTLEVAPLTRHQAAEAVTKRLEQMGCIKQLPTLLDQYLSGSEERLALAFAFSWLLVSGGNSVLPHWVRHRFRGVSHFLSRLRDTPCDLEQCHWCRQMHNPLPQLQHFFGFNQFRATPEAADGSSLQQQIVTHAMADRPLLAILPTGGGKSLCFQLPALVRYQRRGVLTIVISPLQALMKDQVDNLRNKTGSPNAAALNGLLTAPERGEVLERLRLGDIAILYLSPEQLRNRSFNHSVIQREIGAWIFDEAHCLSKWGHDFRPDYLYAGRRIVEIATEQQTPIPPVQCFTATAKEDVKAEIMQFFQNHLQQEMTLFDGKGERENLSFEVQVVSRLEKFSRIQSLLSERLQEDGAAVIYCATRSSSDQLAQFLVTQEWAAESFHAGLEPPRKQQVQENFIHGTTQIVTATNAFGMGIDKENVRLVIHADIPGSLENYIQEAGRAGRDLQQAQCLLLYDENDIETQFRLSAQSQLTRHDIAQILRGLRAAKTNREGSVVLTSGELLHAPEVVASFSADDYSADTRVRTAVTWLERAGFIERNQNQTQVFQGSPRVRNLEEAKQRISQLQLSQRQQQRWMAILEALINAPPDQGFSADDLAQIAAFAADEEEDTRPDETAAQRVLRTLHAMAEGGLIHKSLQMTAYIRYKVKDSSLQRLNNTLRLEQAMLNLMREAAPDADSESWQSLHLRQLNQQLIAQGFNCLPEQLRLLLQSLARDGRGLAGQRGSIDIRYRQQDHYLIKLQRSWGSLLEIASRRGATASLALETIIAKIAADTRPGADILLEFSAEEILDTMQRDLLLAAQLRDPLAALDRGLLFLHEQKVITLQQGLAVFRSAMTIRLLPESKGRRYSQRDFTPLSQHYEERVFQVHVMNEYARRGVEKIGQALQLVAAYFSLDKSDFIRRYFSDRQESLQRATGEASYHNIVEVLDNPRQQKIVTASAESNHLILAGPGAGKTRIIVHRCGYLLRVLRQPAVSLLVLCFNHHAAIQLRQRLRTLIGDDARGITVQTYHGLALRLSGHSLLSLTADGEQIFDFDAVLREAVALLRGERAVPGIEGDAVRDQVLAGVRHILVDEYQDIDALQYQLVSAIAGRSLSDPEQRLNIMAVGDDDQNIYRFRGARVDFIRRFCDDYQAEIHYLVENYRSSAHIIHAANTLIAANRQRLKQAHPITIDHRRRDLPPGGRWSELDPVSCGRVERLEIEAKSAQAVVILHELQRLQRLDGDLQGADCAILSFQWSSLNPIRALLRWHRLTVGLTLQPDERPSPFRVRENRLLLDYLRQQRQQLLTVSAISEWLLPRLEQSAPNGSPWRSALETIVANWREEAGSEPQPALHFEESLYEQLHQQRREQVQGDGIFVGTIHSAKGMEFNQVFLVDDHRVDVLSTDRAEEQRRLYYVGMTRARERLTLLCQRPQALAATINSDSLLSRTPSPSDNFPPHLVGIYDRIITFRELDLGYPGRFGANHPVHDRLRSLQSGDPLTISAQGGRITLVSGDIAVAALSRNGVEIWQRLLPQILELRVIVITHREREGTDPRYHHLYPCSEWEVPLVEVTLRATEIGT